MSIQDLIASASERLTPTERRIVEAIHDDATLLAFGTVSDLAIRVGTSRPSIVRFATKLGFEGYTDLQQWVREDVSQQLSRPSQRIRHHRDARTPARVEIENAVHVAFETLEGAKLDALARPIADATRVWILSGESSRAGAHVLRSGLSMVRPDVRLIEEHSAARDLSGAEPTDTAVVFDFARYRRHSVTAARLLAERGVCLVAITDGPLSPLASLTPTWCQLKIPAVGPFDSSVPAVVAAELLVAEVVRQLGEKARDRIDHLESLWQQTGTFIDDSPRAV